MPQVQDAQVALAGSVIALELLRDFETKQPSGEAKVSVIAGDGIAVVKLSADRVRELAPVVGDQVAWMVRNVPWSMEGGRSGMSTAFVRLVDFADVDLLSSIMQNSGAKVPAGK